VILEATITTEGAVDDVGILRDPDAALSQAAIDAVSQWAFTPTLLNCEAVPVVMNVTVNYVLR
jgi:TonB family protein